MTDKEQEREYRTVSYLCSTLANICSAPPNMVIDALTGLLWDEGEAGKIKAANAPEEPANAGSNRPSRDSGEGPR